MTERASVQHGDITALGIGRASFFKRKVPTSTAPPYPHELSLTGKSSLANVWSRSGLLRRDIRTNINNEGLGASGLLLDLNIRVIRAGRLQQPVPGAAVYVWHSDANGEYSVYGRNDATYLRGIGTTGADGRVQFKSIYPGTYHGREPHVHFEIYRSLNETQALSQCLLRSRVLFPESVTREIYKSNLMYRRSVKTFEGLVFGKPGGSLTNPSSSSQVALVSGSARKGVRASITVPILI
jgi:protocatechuate 3,4-dioxygenase beta subunit